MEKRIFGNTNMLVTPICFGTWEIGGFPFFKNQEEQDSIEIIKEALQFEINFIDTAPVYGFGHAEKLVGKAIQGKRDKLFISTKCGLRWKEEKQESIYTNASRESILEEIDLSLKRLNCDYIDLYLIHWPDKDTQTPIGESIEVLEKLKAIGKIKYYGVSNFNVGQLKEAARYGTLSGIQNQYSLVKPGIENTVLPYAVEHSLGVQIYSPLERGVLTDKSMIELKEKKEPAVDWILNGINEKKLKGREALKIISVRYNVPLATFIIACTMKRSGISTLIVGTQKKDHLYEASKGAKLEISQEDLKEVDKIISSLN